MTTKGSEPARALPFTTSREGMNDERPMHLHDGHHALPVLHGAGEASTCPYPKGAMMAPIIVKISRFSDAMTLNGYYSTTFDVLAGVGEEEEYHLETLASFRVSDDATAFVRAYKGSAYVIGIRPPTQVVRDALAWLHIVSSSQVEGVTIQGR